MFEPEKKYSRFSLSYLASRHAGACFLFLALGILVGVVRHVIVGPTTYHSGAEVAVRAVPADAGPRLLNAGLERWRGWLRSDRDQALLSTNLRFALKLAVTHDLRFDNGPPGLDLTMFEPEATFSTLLLRNPLLADLGERIAVSRADIPAAMDYQSLAAVVADLDPPSGATGWDFTFFRASPPTGQAAGVVANPGPGDHFFRVFYKLHELRTGRKAPSPSAAWRAAVDEIAERLTREKEFAGGGGFGPAATREIRREIASIPVLAANGLYRIDAGLSPDPETAAGASWKRKWGRSATLDLLDGETDETKLLAGVTIGLNPAVFPRDTAYTRITPLAVATLLQFIVAREDAAGDASRKSSPAAQPAAPVKEASPEPPRPAAVPAAPAPPVHREVIDGTAAQERLSRIAMHEESARMAVLERDAALRRLDAARADENRLGREAYAARSRADRLRERYDAAEAAEEKETGPSVPPEAAALFTRRDEVFARLKTLLQYCTEEHPFVREARRELRSLEAQLAQLTPDEAANRAAEARATRLANLYLEWESASAQADSADERARRQGEAAACLIDEVTNLERVVSRRELEVSRAKASPVPVIRIQDPVPFPEPEPVAETPRPETVPEPPSPPVAAAPRLEFDPLPARIQTARSVPRPWAIAWGALAGIAAGLLCALLRELLGGRFRNAREAESMVGLPVLAALPAYDPVSFRAAAAGMDGEIAHTRAGKAQFIPAAVEYSEPPPEARRGRVLPATRRPRLLAAVFGILFLMLAGALYYKSLTGFDRWSPPPGGLRPPTETIRAWLEDGEKWGNLP